MQKLMIQAHLKWIGFADKMMEILISKEGEGFVDTALKIIISIVIGAALLAGLYAIFKDTILPTLQQRIEDMFDFAG